MNLDIEVFDMWTIFEFGITGCPLFSREQSVIVRPLVVQDWLLVSRLMTHMDIEGLKLQ